MSSGSKLSCGCALDYKCSPSSYMCGCAPQREGVTVQLSPVHTSCKCECDENLTSQLSLRCDIHKRVEHNSTRCEFRCEFVTSTFVSHTHEVGTGLNWVIIPCVSHWPALIINRAPLKCVLFRYDSNIRNKIVSFNSGSQDIID